MYHVRVKVKSLSHVRLFATPRTVAYQAPPSIGFSRQEYWSGVPFPSPGTTKGKLKIYAATHVLSPPPISVPLSPPDNHHAPFQSFFIQNTGSYITFLLCYVLYNVLIFPLILI